MMERVVIDRDIPYIKGVFEQFVSVEYLKGDLITPKDVVNATVLIVRTRTKCNAELLANSSVKLIVTATIGTDHIDMDWCKQSGITVKSAQGSNARGVLQWVSAALVAMSNRYGWNPEVKTIGVVGVGHVGSLVAEFAQVWGFNVLRCDPPRAKAENLTDLDGYVEFETILQRCDIVTFHTPLKRQGEYKTYHMLNADNIEILSKETTILNSSRGEVIETQALISHVNSGGSCCVDTWEFEPNINLELLRVADIATQHIAGYSKQGKATATAIAVETVAKHLSIPIKDWFPCDVHKNRVSNQPTWRDLCNSIREYCDIECETKTLKANYGDFEELRCSYNYREEYF